jgi:molybdopterin synthase sulfur carrier subunit
MIKVLYFASLREQLGTGAETLEMPPGVTDMAGLSSALAARGGAWQTAFGGGQTLMMAVNQDAARPDTPIADKDEIAYYPPVTGG